MCNLMQIFRTFEKKWIFLLKIFEKMINDVKWVNNREMYVSVAWNGAWNEAWNILFLLNQLNTVNLHRRLQIFQQTRWFIVFKLVLHSMNISRNKITFTWEEKKGAKLIKEKLRLLVKLDVSTNRDTIEIEVS